MTGVSVCPSSPLANGSTQTYSPLWALAFRGAQPAGHLCTLRVAGATLKCFTLRCEPRRPARTSLQPSSQTSCHTLWADAGQREPRGSRQTKRWFSCDKPRLALHGGWGTSPSSPSGTGLESRAVFLPRATLRRMQQTFSLCVKSTTQSLNSQCSMRQARSKLQQVQNKAFGSFTQIYSNNSPKVSLQPLQHTGHHYTYTGQKDEEQWI